MKIQEISSELNNSLCPAGSEASMVEHSTPHSATHAETDKSALKLVQTENASLKLLILDLIRENQQLRDRMSAAKSADSIESAIAS
jgi:hypothetical protein